MTPFVPCTPPTEADIQKLLKQYRAQGLKPNEHNIRFLATAEQWQNDTYHVTVLGRGTGMVHLSIKRLDLASVHNWNDLQEIKNQFVGKECEGVELYPAESRRLDATNQYHLWVREDATFRYPFGFKERLVI